MKGDRALLWPKMIKTLTKISIMIIGASHQAFLIFKKSNVSLRKDLFFDNRLTYSSTFQLLILSLLLIKNLSITR